MPRERELTDIAGELVAPFETAAAYRFHDGAKTVWLPKSQCEWDEQEAVMTMPVWLAQEKELI
jgi:hypothetical protein